MLQVLVWEYYGAKLFLCLAFLGIFGSAELYAEEKKDPFKEFSEKVLLKIKESPVYRQEKVKLGFRKEGCLFLQEEAHYEKDGYLSSRFRLEIPLREVYLRSEKHRYDSFFQCKDQENCIVEKSLDKGGKLLLEQRQVRSQLYFSDKNLGLEILKLFLSVQSVCQGKEYEGPAGLKWEQNKIEVRRRLLTDLRFLRRIKVGSAGEERLLYRGGFSGFRTKDIWANFFDDRFYQMVIWVLPERTPQRNRKSLQEAYSKTWIDLVQQIQYRYGKPKRILFPTGLPAIENFDLDQAEFQELDEEVRQAEWRPFAVWSFENNVSIVVQILVREEKLDLVWKFTKDDIRAKIQGREEVDENRYTNPADIRVNY